MRIRNTNNEKFELCYKQKIGNQVVEIEKIIEKQDFENLWSVCFNKLRKIRYYTYFDSGGSWNDYLWEIDAFKDENETYFLMAEHEMPEEQLQPDFIPKLIFDNLLFSVPREDDRFSSNKLANIEHAKEMYLLLKGNKNVSTNN